jgi:DNA polymerase/3'-5' exonuclease PolX
MKGTDLSNIFELYAEKLAVDPNETARYRSLNYKKTADLIFKTFGNKKVMVEDVVKMKITEHMKQKIIGTLASGQIPQNRKHNQTSYSIPDQLTNQKEINDRIEKQKEKKEIIEKLSSFSGVGIKKAEEFYKLGVRKIDDLLEKKYEHLLTTEVKAFMEMNPLKTIYREDIAIIEKILLECAPSELIFVGSYRRKKPFSSDVDIMFVERDEPNDEHESKNFQKVMLCLEKMTNKMIVYVDGPDKLSCICDFSKITKKIGNIFKVDVFRTTTDTKIPYLLYTTGSKENNIAMRSKAKRMGLLLNQNGLFKNEKRIDIKFKNEKDYYDALGLPYKKPEER